MYLSHQLPNADHHGPNRSLDMNGKHLRAHFQKLGPVAITRAASVDSKSLLEDLRPLPATKSHIRSRLATGV